jgi:hypothetical protein
MPDSVVQILGMVCVCGQRLRVDHELVEPQFLQFPFLDCQLRLVVLQLLSQSFDLLL